MLPAPPNPVAPNRWARYCVTQASCTLQVEAAAEQACLDSCTLYGFPRPGKKQVCLVSSLARPLFWAGNERHLFAKLYHAQVGTRQGFSVSSGYACKNSSWLPPRKGTGHIYNAVAVARAVLHLWSTICHDRQKLSSVLRSPMGSREAKGHACPGQRHNFCLANMLLVVSNRDPQVRSMQSCSIDIDHWPKLATNNTSRLCHHKLFRMNVLQNNTSVPRALRALVSVIPDLQQLEVAAVSWGCLKNVEDDKPATPSHPTW